MVMRYIICMTLLIIVSCGVVSSAQETVASTQYMAYSVSNGADCVDNVPVVNACRNNCGSSCGLDRCGYAKGSGFIAGYEFLWLKPQFTNNLSYTSTEGLNIQGFGLDTDYDFAPRVWFGYQFCNGFSARLRYWQFDNKLDDVTLESENGINYQAPAYFDVFFSQNGPITVRDSLKADVIDLDFLQDFYWCRSRFSVGGGISYAGLRMDRYLYTDSFYDYTTTESRIAHFEGIGPTLTAELKRQFGSSGFSFVGGIRGTVLFGKQRYQITDVMVSGESVDESGIGMSADCTRSILAGWIGVQYDRRIFSTTDMFVRLSWEGQYWNSFGLPMYSGSSNSSAFENLSGNDVAFQGLGIAFGIRR